jgi:hypothetical protein
VDDAPVAQATAAARGLATSLPVIADAAARRRRPRRRAAGRVARRAASRSSGCAPRTSIAAALAVAAPYPNPRPASAEDVRAVLAAALNPEAVHA